MQKSNKQRKDEDKKALNTPFSKKIFEAVELSGKNLHDIAKQCGISLRTLGHWRAGNYLPDLREAVILAKVLGVPVEFFFPGHENENKFSDTENEIDYEKLTEAILSKIKHCDTPPQSTQQEKHQGGGNYMGPATGTDDIHPVPE